eukprot:gene2016-2716_t
MPLTDDTHYMIDEAAFDKAKKGLRIFNCARGGIIKETALIAGALKVVASELCEVRRGALGPPTRIRASPLAARGIDMQRFRLPPTPHRGVTVRLRAHVARQSCRSARAHAIFGLAARRGAVTRSLTPSRRLFFMMVLEFFIWGAWLPLIFGYLPSLGFTPTQQSPILNAFPVASIVGMFFSNQWADRKFNPEKFLAFSHLIGGLAILGCGFTKEFVPFFLLMLVHCLLYVPTISITNSIAFANMKNPEKEFGIVRMGGTIGWILAAWPFTFISVNWAAVDAAHPAGLVDWLGKALANPLTGDAAKAATKWTFIVAGLASLLLAAFALTLPRTAKQPAATGGGGRRGGARERASTRRTERGGGG